MEPVSANGSREQATKISRRRVCDLVGVDAKTVRRERPPDHADIRKKMHEIAEMRRRFGYRRGLVLSRICAAPSARLRHLTFESHGAFPSQR